MNEVPTASAYANEPVQFHPLQVADLSELSRGTQDSYRNMVVNRVNQHCLRLAVMHESYPWHHHPESDELFLVVEGRLHIDLEDGRTLSLGPWQTTTIPAGTVHRTRAEGRTVNLCFEALAAETVFLPEP